MLYEGALSSVDRAAEMFRAGDIIGRGKAITKATAIIDELRASLRNGPQPEYASRLAELYGYMITRLHEAHTKKSERPLAEVSRLLRSLYEGWLGVMRQSAVTSEEESARECEAVAAASPYEMLLEQPRAGRSWQV